MFYLLFSNRIVAHIIVVKMWKLDSLAFRGVCTSWNRGVRTILHLPFTTHTYMLGPLMRQTIHEFAVI